jgi:Family of unknown function (DUF6221)
VNETDPVAWLRRQIEGDKWYAEALIEDEEVADRWEEPSSGVLQTGSPEAADHWAGCWPCGYSILSRHIVQHDPLNTLADCEAKLAILDTCVPILGDGINFTLGEQYRAEEIIAHLVGAYKHREGFDEKWLSPA